MKEAMNGRFITELSGRIGRDRKSTQALLEGLRTTLVQHCAEPESVAVPGFGTFKSVKHEETVSRDLSTGRTLLLPPEVTIEFSPASRLRKIAERNVDTE